LIICIVCDKIKNGRKGFFSIVIIYSVLIKEVL